jgi:HprK-related kinase A
LIQTLRVGDLSRDELRRRLRGAGLSLRSGPLVFEIRSREPEIEENLPLLYADTPLGNEDFADFHIEVRRARGLRGWMKPQVEFLFEDRSPFQPLPQRQSFAMLEWGMNWCVANHCHQYLVIHAAVIERNGLAAILPAPPGSGKSTLCAALIHAGWRLCSDELTVLDPADGAVVALARPVSLKNGSIEVIGAFARQAQFGREVPDTKKGRVSHLRPPAGSVEQVGIRAKPRWVIFPKWQADAALEVGTQPKSQAFIQLAENAFNYSMLGETGFDLLAGVIDASDCLSLRYSRLEEAIAWFNTLADEATR